ncbi:MAG: hypothetical protein E3J88_02250, partial [Anaerolineales bacterium]
MENSIPQELKKAIGLLRNGKRREAVPILAEVLHQDRTNEHAWYLLGMAVDEPDKKLYAFKEVLKFNPDNERAKTQLAELAGKSERPQEEFPAKPQPERKPEPSHEEPPLAQTLKEEPKKGFRWAFLLIGLGGLIIFISAIALVSLNSDRLWGTPAVQQLTESPLEDMQPSSTQAGQFTFPPTWTATPRSTAAPSALPTQTPTGTSTPTSLPLPDDVREEMELIQKQVSVLRELPLAENVQNAVMPKLKLKLIVMDLYVDDEYLAGLEDEDRILTIIGFMDPGYDLVEETLNSRVDAIGSFYLPEENKIHVIGTGLYGIEKWIYAHEYGHALQDQHFDLTTLGVYPDCLKPEQNCLAIRALVEGEADLLQEMWLEQFPPEFEYQDILKIQPPSHLFQGQPAPPYFGMNAYFPYLAGYDFASYLYQKEGWAAINQAYRNLPTTTEQILHPEKYFSGETGIPVNDPPLDDKLSLDWRLLKRETFGEWESFLLLGYGNDE